jgi:hypothetical protein
LIKIAWPWKYEIESLGGVISVDSSAGEVTRLLNELKDREEEATPKLFELLYNELRRLAQYYLRSERPDHTLQATALVHEAYVRLVDAEPHWRNRAHSSPLLRLQCAEFW